IPNELAGWSGPFALKCYQESPRFVHWPLPLSYPDGWKERGADGLENATGNVNCSDMNNTSIVCDVVVVGAGPTGLAAAIALAQIGARTALIARRAPYADNRTTALLGGSVDFLQGLEVWPRCRDEAAE